MIRKKAEEIQWLEFELFQEHPELIHGIFLRHGGVSPSPYFSLNLGKGDEICNIRENRRRILQTLHLEHFVSCQQVHGNIVKVIEKQGAADLADSDGMMTSARDLSLIILHADCQAAIFYDPIKRVVANVHSGWRGNVKNIYRETVQKMQCVFGSEPKNLLVGIAPSLGPDHSEFKNYQIEFPQEFWRFEWRHEHFDLWAVARHQLEECGIFPEHIQIAQICTYANPEDYFSYRREGKERGSHATVAALR